MSDLVFSYVTTLTGGTAGKILRAGGVGVPMEQTDISAILDELTTTQPLVAGTYWRDTDGIIRKQLTNIPPTITVQPTNITAGEGTDATFTVTAINATSYVCYKNGVSVGSSNSYTISAVTSANNGDTIQFDCIGPGGTTTSFLVTLLVTIPLLAKWRADTYTGSSGSYSLTDLTGNGYTLTQSAGTVTPGTGVNGAAKLACSVAANFQGSQTIPSRYNKTIITVFKRTGTAQIGLFGAAGATPYNRVWQGFDGTNVRHFYVGNGTGFTAIAQTADAADAGQVRAYCDLSMRHSLVSMRDNRLLPSMNSTSTDGGSVGTSFAPALGTSYRGMVGDWYETRVYDGIMSPTQLDIVAAEINSRYALSLPLWSSLTQRDMILIAGQSNASGPVAMASLPSGYAGAQTGVDIWTGTAYGSTIETLNSTSNNNQGAGASRQNTYGFEMSVGKDYIARVGGSVTLYKYAAGSTALSTLTASNWAPATLASLARGFMYQYWLTRYAMQQLGQRPNPLAMCWFQGEQDATDLTSANAYEANLTEFIASLNGQLSGVIDWYICRLANEGTTGAYLATVRTAQAAVATALNHVELVDTDSYQMADAVHLGATGQIDLGTHLAGLI